MRREVLEVRRWVAVAVVAAALVAGGLFSTWAVHWSGQRAFGSAKVPLQIAADPHPVSLGAFGNGFASVIDPALPAVVNISSSKIVKRRNNVPGFFFNDPFFRQFFGDQFGQQFFGPQTQREQSLGSGVIVNPDGYILTNNHVVAGASDIEVFTRNKEKFKAKVVGTDPHTDVAVLKIDASGLPTMTLGDSSKLKVGDVVFAIGDPFGIGETATMGIVSATGRSLHGEIENYEDFIQTDAAINPGNSGGALINLHGDLIGVNTAIITGGGGGNQGIGFAIPINMARNVMEQIIEHGKVIRGFMGVTIQGVNADMAKAFGLSHGGGALVAEVSPNSPAAKAGLEKGDIILEMNGEPISDYSDLSVRVAQTAPGTTIHLKVFRNGHTRDVAVTLAEYPEKVTETAQSGSAAGGTALEGVEVENLTPDIAQQLGLPEMTRGVVITSVDPSSPAAYAGLQRGDVIQEVNHKPVRNVEQYRQALAGTDDQPVLLLINHGGTNLFVVIQSH